MTREPNALDEAIVRGLDALEKRQRSSGLFTIYRSLDPAFEKDCIDDRTPFGTALIAYCLGFSDAPQARRIVHRAAAFLRNEMDDAGVWRYWTRDHPYYRNIPPDVDDIACAAVVLRRHGSSFPDPREILLACRDRAGRFYTWLTPRVSGLRSAAYRRATLRQLRDPVRSLLFWTLFSSKPNDVDAVVNANALFALGDGSHAAPIVAYLTDVVTRGDEAIADKWHRNRFTFYYAISRCDAAGIAGLASVREPIVARIVAALRDGVSPLDTALAACALLNYDVVPAELDAAVDTLVRTQRPDGDWPAIAMYFGGPNADAGGYGSEELTAGFCLEALVRYRARVGPSTESGSVVYLGDSSRASDAGAPVDDR